MASDEFAAHRASKDVQSRKRGQPKTARVRRDRWLTAWLLVITLLFCVGMGIITSVAVFPVAAGMNSLFSPPSSQKEGLSAGPETAALPTETVTRQPGSPTVAPTATPTQTPWPTATTRPTETPTLTPSATPTEADTPTPLPTDTPEPVPPTAVLPPSQQSSGTGGVKWIEVDLSEQRLYAWEGKTLVAVFLISSGAAPYHTITGSYPIYEKHLKANMWGPGYFLPDVPYTMYFYKGYGIHGTYWHNNFGTPMSHGCINLSIPDAEWLYGWAPLGTSVKVHY
ncbi:MAG: hypothetical protein DDG60_00890 [Anaerolineae bacterium]|nr:MAG: hypothetical protein DDG60_00890 [Anaerolineae bacterium]